MRLAPRAGLGPTTVLHMRFQPVDATKVILRRTGLYLRSFESNLRRIFKDALDDT